MSRKATTTDSQRSEGQPGEGGHELAKVIRVFNARIRPYMPVSGGVLAVIIVLFGIVSVVRASKQDRLARGYAALSMAADIDDVTSISHEYEGTAVGAKALLESGRRLYQAGKFEQAQTKFRLFTGPLSLVANA